MPAVSVVWIPDSEQIVPLLTGHDGLHPLHIGGVTAEAGGDLVHLLGVEAGDAGLDHLKQRTVCQLRLTGLGLLECRGAIGALVLPLAGVVNLILIDLSLFILLSNIHNSLNILLSVSLSSAGGSNELPRAPISPGNIVGCPPLGNKEFVTMLDLDN